MLPSVAFNVQQITTYFWSGRWIMESAFQWLFSPDEIVWYRPSLHQIMSVNVTRHLIKEFGLFNLALGQDF